MSSVVHIPISELPDAHSLRDRILVAEEIVVETGAGDIRFTRERKGPGRTAAEIFSNPKLLEAMGDLDDHWAKDMEEIIALRKTEVERDPWA